MKITYFTVSRTNMYTGETFTKCFFREKSAVKAFYNYCNDHCYTAFHILEEQGDVLKYAQAGGPGYDMMFTLNYNYLPL